eukprot:5784455-Alexandrium_andersonii.AAC.1
MVQHDGHHRAVILSPRQAQTVYKQQSRVDSCLKSCPRAAGEPCSSGTSDIQRCPGGAGVHW